MEEKPSTEMEFRDVMGRCRDLFVKKMHDYGTAWSVMRPQSVTDQLYIKACRIRSLEVKRKAMVDEGVTTEFVAIVNYAIMGLIALEREGEGAPTTTPTLLAPEEALARYDRHADEAMQLMVRKNHDYDEAWRGMRVSSYTDLILMKLLRTKQIENLAGQTLVSEGVAANYMDMMNYAVFGLIKLTIEHEGTPT